MGEFMKYLAIFFATVLTIGVNKAVLANEPDAVCSTQTTEKCPPADTHAAKSSHSDLSTEMNSLFPEKQKNSKIASRPPAVELTGPKFLSKISGDVKLEWKPTAGADSYHLQIATDPNFKWLVVQEQSLKQTAYGYSKGEPGKKYYWRVAAINSKNDSMYTKSNFTGSVFVAK